MKRVTAYAVTAVTALTMAGAMNGTASAAVPTYNLSAGNGKMIVITGNSREDLKSLLNRISGGTAAADCLPVFPDHNFPLPERPSPEAPLPDSPSPEFPSPEAPLPDSPPAGTEDRSVEAVWELVNEERSRAGLPPLTLHTGASQAAQTRAEELVSSFSHTRPDGSSFTTALTAAGVSYRAAGENIAYGQKTAEQVMQDWMNSAGHRANILNGNYSSVGIGHYKNAAGVDYWTQIFIN